LKDQNTTLAFGSDAPVESPNPFWGIHAAVTRQRMSGYPSPEGWQKNQKLSLHEALEAYTTGPAYACGQEKSLGQLAPGFLADLIVLDQDPFKQPAQNLYSIAPVATMVGGQWVWQS
jgi:predicted amidohydrolase YtcJ